VAHTCNLATTEAEVGGPEFKSSLGKSMKLYLKKKKKLKSQRRAGRVAQAVELLLSSNPSTSKKIYNFHM
jgi:hypothetical protein